MGVGVGQGARPGWGGGKRAPLVLFSWKKARGQPSEFRLIRGAAGSCGRIFSRGHRVAPVLLAEKALIYLKVERTKFADELCVALRVEKHQG